jgi:prevent-host-death family protein
MRRRENMRTVGTHEAKTHLPRLLDEVARGHTIVITERGIPVAKLIPVAEERRRSKREVVEALQDYQRAAPPLDGVSVKELIVEGRE